MTEGDDAVIIAYGPILLSVAVQVANRLKLEVGKAVKVINLPWLNRIDEDWLIQEIGDCPLLISLDNHYYEGGQGGRVAEIIAKSNKFKPKFIRFGIEGIPVSGSNHDVLQAHKLSTDEIFESMSSLFKTGIGVS